MASVAHVDEWADECASVSEVEQALIGLRLRRGFVGKRNLRTTVLTHIAWVPRGVAAGGDRNAGEARGAPTVSDIVWRRTLPWRVARPSLARAADRLAGPRAEAALVPGWLRARSGAEVTVEQADELPHAEDLDPSDLLSEQLDVFGRDRIYEEAVRSAGRL